MARHQELFLSHHHHAVSTHRSLPALSGYGVSSSTLGGGRTRSLRRERAMSLPIRRREHELQHGLEDSNLYLNRVGADVPNHWLARMLVSVIKVRVPRGQVVPYNRPSGLSRANFWPISRKMQERMEASGVEPLSTRTVTQILLLAASFLVSPKCHAAIRCCVPRLVFPRRHCDRTGATYWYWSGSNQVERCRMRGDGRSLSEHRINIRLGYNSFICKYFYRGYRWPTAAYLGSFYECRDLYAPV